MATNILPENIYTDAFSIRVSEFFLEELDVSAFMVNTKGLIPPVTQTQSHEFQVAMVGRCEDSREPKVKYQEFSYTTKKK
jgi:hypothetical protein